MVCREIQSHGENGLSVVVFSNLGQGGSPIAPSWSIAKLQLPNLNNPSSIE